MLPTKRNRLARFASGPALVAAAVLLPGCSRADAGLTTTQEGMPRVLDERLELSLFAADPEIVTPIGIAIDARDRVFVLESHTHSPPQGYDGPPADRIKIFLDENGDGHADRSTVFAEGITDGMNLAFSPDGELYVVTARGVWALHDRDGDGRSEERTQVLSLVEPEYVYEHAGLLGIAFSPDGWMYVSRGNIGGGDWKLVGTDGSTAAGYGDGGNIMRARPDGTGLEEVATGFWNPFGIEFDDDGRLLAVDNDPDSRGPNRLLHVVPGGDYGYQSLYGGSGIHPYQSWNSELPGTLPYAAPLGEAPSGILDASRTALPLDYRNDVIASVWEESNVVRVPLAPRGSSVAGVPQVIVQGGRAFRPVAFATDSRGTVYFTDWMIRQYPNHGSGRIWRLATREGIETLRPTRPRPTATREEVPALQRLYDAQSASDFPTLRTALRSDDPFVRHAATVALARPVFRTELLAATRDAEADVRLGALLALMRAESVDGEPVARALLSDPDARVRKMALIWAGRSGMLSLRSELERAITTGAPSPELFEIYVATLEQLTPEFVQEFAAKTENAASEVTRELPPAFIQNFVSDPARPAELRAIALTHLENPQENVALLTSLAGAGAEVGVRREAIRSLGYTASAEGGEVLLRIAADAANPAELRADALVALTRQPTDATALALRLLDDPSEEVRIEAARYLRGRSLDDTARAAVQRKRTSLGTGASPLAEQLAEVLNPGERDPGRPGSPEEWERALATGGDPARGRRVFHSLQSTCSQCHMDARRGGTLGPDLSNVGRSKTREQLVRAIVRPSAEISPEFQGWYIRMKDGTTHYGRQIDVGGDGAKLYMPSGEFVEFQDYAEYGVAEKSLMPEGLESRLTLSEMRDLVAYMQHSK